MDKPIGVQIAESKAEEALKQHRQRVPRVQINTVPASRDALAALLNLDERFIGIGYSEFILRAVACADTILSTDLWAQYGREPMHYEAEDPK